MPLKRPLSPSAEPRPAASELPPPIRPSSVPPPPGPATPRSQGSNRLTTAQLLQVATKFSNPGRDEILAAHGTSHQAILRDHAPQLYCFEYPHEAAADARAKAKKELLRKIGSEGVDKESNYRIQVCLGWSSVPMYRTLSCPARATFQQLHWALVHAFEWDGLHAYEFSVRAEKKHRREVRRLEIHMQKYRFESTEDEETESGDDESDVEKSAPRRKEKKTRSKNDQVHDANHQQSEGNNGGEDDFPFDLSCYTGDPLMDKYTTPAKTAKETRLWHVLEDPRYKGAELEYVFDLGEQWRHELYVKGRTEKTNYFEIVAGEGGPVEGKEHKTVEWRVLERAYDWPFKEQSTDMRRKKRKYISLLKKGGTPDETLNEAGFFTQLESVNRTLKSKNVDEKFDKKKEYILM